MDKELYNQLLFDYYGSLLTEKQENILHLYYEDNLTLGEISENLQTSRQAVHDTIRRAQRMLNRYDKALNLINDAEKRNKVLTQAIDLLDEISEKSNVVESSDERLCKIKELLYDLRNED